MYTESDVEAIDKLNDYLRTFRMNALYYDERLRRTKIVGLIFDVSIAIGTSTAAVAGGITFRYASVPQPVLAVGEYIWVIAAMLSAFAATMKPTLGIGTKIEQLSTAQSRYQSAFLRTERLLTVIRRSEYFTCETSDGPRGNRIGARKACTVGRAPRQGTIATRELRTKPIGSFLWKGFGIRNQRHRWNKARAQRQHLIFRRRSRYVIRTVRR